MQKRSLRHAPNWLRGKPVGVMEESVTPAVLRELIDYDAETGIMRWRTRTAEHFSGESRVPLETRVQRWNARYAGELALVSVTRGYRTGRIFDLNAAAHRVAWAIWHGRWPEGQIDHVNGDRSDNRIGNLREVTACANHKNVGKKRSNKSGVTGVYWNKSRRRWQAQIGVDNSMIYLGAFVSLEAARLARAAAERMYGFTAAHGKRPAWSSQ